VFQRQLNSFTFSIFVLSFFLPIFSYAQVSLKFSHETLFDSNVFNNYEGVSDIVNQPNIQLFYQTSTDKSAFQIGYDGSLVYFSEFQSRQFQVHQIEIAGKRLLSENGLSLSWGMSGSKRLNQADYEYYNYQYGNGFITFLNNTKPFKLFSFGAEGEYRNYDYLTQFNYWTLGGFIRYSFFFQSKTTLIGKLSAGFKKFTESIYNEEDILEIVDTPGKGKGRGWGNGNNENGQEDVNRVVRLESPSQTIFKWIGILRLAQSLGSRTGLALQGEIQKIPGGGGRFLTGQDSGYESNDVLFDDPFSYERLGATVELTQLLPWKIMMKSGFGYAEKAYDRPAYDWDGNPLEDTTRFDQITSYWMSFKKSIPLKSYIRRMVFSFNYYNSRNESNDLYYQYSHLIKQLAVQLELGP